MKAMFVAVLVCQLAIINYFVASWDGLWGFNIVWQLVNGVDWRTNGFFPRVIADRWIMLKDILGDLLRSHYT